VFHSREAATELWLNEQEKEYDDDDDDDDDDDW